MKKLLSLSFIMLLFSITASAQVRDRVLREINGGTITRIENIQLHKDQLRYKILQRNARRDGIITPLEKRRTQKARRKCRVDTVRLRHNERRR